MRAMSSTEHPDGAVIPQIIPLCASLPAHIFNKDDGKKKPHNTLEDLHVKDSAPTNQSNPFLQRSCKNGPSDVSI